MRFAVAAARPVDPTFTVDDRRGKDCPMRTRWPLVTPLLALALLALSSPGPAGAAEVVVYSARSHYNQEPAFDAFTKKTGIQVKTFGGNSSELFERLRAEGARS